MNELTGLRRGDAAIVGGGLTGLLLASRLAQAGLRVLLLDTGECSIPPCNAMATPLCISAYQRIRAIHGLEAARQYASALMSQLCDMRVSAPPYVQNLPACIYARTEQELPFLLAQQELLGQLGLPVSIAQDAGGCPFPVERSLIVPNQLLVDMVQWKSALLSNIRRHDGQLFGRAPISSLHSTKVCTQRGCLEAPRIIFAGGIPPCPSKYARSPLLERHALLLSEMRGPFPLHSSQQPVQQGVILYPSKDEALALWDAGRCGSRLQEHALPVYEQALSAQLPDWQQKTSYALYTIHSADGLPVIGTLPGTRHLLASGAGEAGILGELHAAAVLTRRILGHPLPEDQLYAPDRLLPRSFISQQQRRRRTQAFLDWLRWGVPVCSHCHRRLRYCSWLSRWDCPSCGSAFDILGQVVCGPAMHPAQLSARQRPDR